MNSCPNCNSSQIQYDCLEIDTDDEGQYARQEAVCIDCEHEWVEIYNYAGIAPVRVTKEEVSADIYRNRIPQDRCSQHVRPGQAHLEGTLGLDLEAFAKFGEYVFKRREPDSLSEVGESSTQSGARITYEPCNGPGRHSFRITDNGRTVRLYINMQGCKLDFDWEEGGCVSSSS